jgi:hypothetical protein
MAAPRIQSNEEVLQTAARIDGKIRLRVVFEVYCPRIEVADAVPAVPPPAPPPRKPLRPREDLRVGDVFTGPLGTFRVRRFSPPNKKGTAWIFYQRVAKDGEVKNGQSTKNVFMKQIDGHERVEKKRRPPKVKPAAQLKEKKHIYRELRHQAVVLTAQSPGAAWQVVRAVQNFLSEASRNPAVLKMWTDPEAMQIREQILAGTMALLAPKRPTQS